MSLNSLALTHRFLCEHVREGALCIDATAGNGGDTALLCELVGESGHVFAFDIQAQAVAATQALLAARGFANRARVLLDSHTNMAAYVQPETVDAIVFNFGWLPGGDHGIFTTAATSIPALEQGLTLLKSGGVMSLCVYYGGENGYAERDALLAFLQMVDSRRFTVLVCSFHNRENDPPIPILIIKQG